MTDYRGKLVKKPWGHERQLIETPDHSVAVWHLHIEAGQSTSMHCHQRKKTTLVVLSNRATVQFIGGSMQLVAGQKVRFAPGQYHQTGTDHVDGVDLLEVETPSDKQDLIRLEDQYGRAGKGYEGAESITDDPTPLPPLRIVGNLLTEHLPPWVIGQCNVFGQRFPINHGAGMMILLSGGILRGSDRVLSPGDVVEASLLKRLATKFTLLPSEVIEVSRC